MHPIWNVPVPGSNMSPDQVVLWDDFIQSSFSATDDAATWRIITDAGATVTLANAQVGGVVSIKNASALADESLIRNNGASFAVADNKKLTFGVRFKLTDANDMDVRIGLMTPDQTDPGDTPPTNGIYFTVALAGADGSLDLTVEPGATDTDTGLDLTDDTFVSAWFVAEGSSKVVAYVDLEDGSGPRKCATVTSGLPPAGTALQVCASTEGNTATDTLDIDWILVVQER